MRDVTYSAAARRSRGQLSRREGEVLLHCAFADGRYVVSTDTLVGRSKRQDIRHRRLELSEICKQIFSGKQLENVRSGWRNGTRVRRWLRLQHPVRRGK